MLRRKRTKDEPAQPPEPEVGDEFGFDERMNAILREVRAEADRILEDARRRAAAGADDLDRQLADRRRRLVDLADQLIARAEAVLGRLDDVAGARQSLEGMVRALGQAADEISFELSATPLGPRGVEPQPPGSASVEERDRDAAIKLAAGGATRSQVDSHLREFSEAGDPSHLLDQVFGPASGDDARVPWAVQRERR